MANKPITNQDIQQADNYNNAIKELQKSVNGLTYTMPKFADGVEAGVKKVGCKAIN